MAAISACYRRYIEGVRFCCSRTEWTATKEHCHHQTGSSRRNGPGTSVTGSCGGRRCFRVSHSYLISLTKAFLYLLILMKITIVSQEISLIYFNHFDILSQKVRGPIVSWHIQNINHDPNYNLSRQPSSVTKDPCPIVALIQSILIARDEYQP